MAELPKPPDAYNDFVARFPQLGEAWKRAQEAGSVGPLDERTARFIKLGIAVGSQREGAVSSAVRKAVAQGASREEIEQVIPLAATTIGFPAAVAIYSWIKAALKKAGVP